ncbi:MAG: hypothetical protein IJD31_06690, partial [Lachnospiraceae bacterium]|nr:hypothetical protein [Lachnospiraceae bacterium]
ELFARCGILREYVVFVEKVRKKSVIMCPDEAMHEAIAECIEEGILLEFFREYGEEIIGMEWYEVTQEMIWEIQREEAIEDARAEGMAEGIEKGIEEGRLLGRKECAAELEKTIQALREEIALLKKQIMPQTQA